MLAGYLVYQFLLVLLTGLFSFLIGKALFSRGSPLDPVTAIALYTPAGTGVLILSLFILGLVQLLALPWVLLAMAVMLAGAIYRLDMGIDEGRRVLSWLRSVSAWQWTIAVAVLIFLVPVLLAPVTPPEGSDEVRFHLPYALHFMTVQGLEPNLALRYPFFSLNINLLYTYGLMLGDDVTPHFLHLYLGVLAALCCFVLTCRHTGTVLALGAALLFLTLPIVTQLANTAYIDLGLACFIFAALLCASTLEKNDQRPLLICAALLLGIGMGSKYLGLAYFPVGVVWAGYFTRSWQAAGKFAGYALLFGLPWYVYNFILSGNPISPFLGEVFGYWPYSELDMQAQQEDLANQGLDSSLTSLLLLPYNLLVRSGAFGLPLVPLLLIPVLLLIPFTPWLDKQVRPWLVLLLVSILIWFFSSQSFRYLLLILPAWCFLSAWLLKRIGDGIAALLAKWTPLTVPGVYIAVAVFVVGIAHQYTNNRFLNYPADVVAKVTHRDTYLADSQVEYGLIRFINDSNLSGETIFQLRAGAMLSYVRDNRVIGDVMGLYGMIGYATRYADSKDGFLEEMADMDVHYFVFRQNFLGRQTAWNNYLRENLDILYEDELFILFGKPGN